MLSIAEFAESIRLKYTQRSSIFVNFSLSRALLRALIISILFSLSSSIFISFLVLLVIFRKYIVKTLRYRLKKKKEKYINRSLTFIFSFIFSSSHKFYIIIDNLYIFCIVFYILFNMFFFEYVLC